MARAATRYYLVTTTRDTEATGSISIKVSGPNAVDGNSASKSNATIEVTGEQFLLISVYSF